MAGVTVVNASTSVVLVDTSVLTSATSSYVVLLSSLQAPGRTVTVRDSVGYLSSPNSIVVSTTAGVRFLDGTTKIDIKGRFGYLTITNYSPTTWTVMNSFGFPDEQAVGSFQSLTTSTLTTRNMYATALTTSTFQVATVNTSTLQTDGTTTTGRLTVGSTIAPPAGYVAAIYGSAAVQGPLSVGDALQVGGAFSTGGDLYVAGSISSLGSAYIGGSLTMGGGLNVPNGALSVSSLSVLGNVTAGGAVSVGTALSVGSSLSVMAEVSSLSHTTSSLLVASSIQMQEKAIVNRATDFFFTHPLSVSSFSTTGAQAREVKTSSLSVRGSIDATTASILQLSTTRIVNPGGSLLVSSISANTVAVMGPLSVNQLGTSSISASSLTLTGDLVITGTGFLSMHTGLFNTIQTNAIFTDSATAATVLTSSLAISSVTVTGRFNASSISTFNMQSAFLNNANGYITTSSLQAQIGVVNSLTVQNGPLISGNSKFTISAPTVYFDAVAISTLTTSSVTAGNVVTKTLTMGSYPSSNVPIGAYWRQSTFPAITTPLNMSTIGSGLGDYFQPLVLSNVKPAGIGPGDPYAVRIDLSVTIPTATGEFVGNTGVGTSYFTWANEPNSYLYFVNNTSQSTSNIVASQLGLAGSNQTTAFTVPAASQNISLPASGNLTIYGELVGDASINIVFGNSSNALVTSAEPSTLIQMNNGRITWNYAYNTTTIENSLNDTSTRNLYYYGSLNSVSDPRVKENIELADLDQCRDIVDAVPLYTYSMRPEYCSTFGVPATQRLGIMATELEEAFPHSVRETTVQGVTLKMVDTQQLEMAHLGTTKRLIQELREIKAYLSNL